MHRFRGFTLVELLVVLAIMGLLVSIVPGAFAKMREGAQYRDTLRAMVSDLRQARHQAGAEARETEFKLDLTQRRFGVVGQPDKAIPDSLQIQATVASKELSQGVAAIRFLPQGGATGGSIDVMRSVGNGTRLTVDWLSGRISQAPLAP